MKGRVTAVSGEEARETPLIRLVALPTFLGEVDRRGWPALVKPLLDRDIAGFLQFP